MIKLVRLLMLFAVLAMMAVSCQNGPNPVEPQVSDPTPLSLITLPDGAVFQSATFLIYAGTVNGMTVNLHRITAPWDETAVTWNNFGGSYAPGVEGSFVANVTGWHSVDVTALVQDWLDGTYENYGFLLEQGLTAYTIYYSSEYFLAYHPKLEICYTLPSGPECVTIQRGALGEVADAYIWELMPDYNGGTSTRLYTGNVYDQEKQTLIQFELPEFREIAAIGDTVWFDENINGIQEPGEWGFPDVTVNLYDCFDNFIATTTTDANGYYLFDNLTPGDYYVEFIKPEGYAFTLQDQGSDDAVDSDADPVTGIAICTTLEPFETDVTWDAGLYLLELDGCTLTIGFWKNHAGTGPQPDFVTPLLPIWLGNEGGTKSIEVTDAITAARIMGKNINGPIFGTKKKSNGIIKLYAQLLGAKLNIENGADGSDVAGVIAEADAFLADYDWTDWRGLSKPEKQMVIGWMSMIDDYNNGIIGPGHCDD